MAFNERYGWDKDNNWVLLEKIEVPEPILPPNWTKLKFDLLTSPVLSALVPTTTPQGFTIFNTFLTDGQNGHSDQKNFSLYFNYMGLTLNDTQKLTINTILTNNNFTIQL
jgi:hypothetical protein